jgi:hypothetical protein
MNINVSKLRDELIRDQNSDDLHIIALYNKNSLIRTKVNSFKQTISSNHFFSRSEYNQELDLSRISDDDSLL